MIYLQIGLTISLLVAALAFWLCYLLLRQNGRILLRVEALARQVHRLSALTPLTIGAEAPAFTLPNLEGKDVSITEFRGSPVLLMFFDPECGFCEWMAQDIARLPVDGTGPVPLIITTGNAEDSRRIFAESGTQCTVLHNDGDFITSLYGTRDFPSGYLVSPEGLIASELAVGADALLALADRNPAGAGSSSDAGSGEDRGLSRSRLQRNGLPAGTVAPDFRLPTPDGVEHALSDYRGRKVLLVFSDPHCGPCQELLPHLKRELKRTPDVQGLMISRGDVGENRNKVRANRIPFPVILQRSWEISKLYAIFTTPVGYLIDGAGVIAAEVAVGGEAILALSAKAGLERSFKEVVPVS